MARSFAFLVWGFNLGYALALQAWLWAVATLIVVILITYKAYREDYVLRVR